MRAWQVSCSIVTALAVTTFAGSLSASPRGDDDCNNNGVPDDQDIANGTEEDVNHNGIPDICERRYVDADAAAGGDGRTWQTAYRRLEDALDNAKPPRQVWVAEGTYRPTFPGGDRSASFVIPDGTSLYGGFAGNEVNLLQRDFLAHPTILSGDLNGNDQPSGDGRHENSYHVIRNFLAFEGQQINGFHITGGQASSSAPAVIDRRGAAIYSIIGQRWTLANCFIYGNRALDGGGAMFLRGVSVDVTNCWFFDNAAGNQNLPGRGGAIYSSEAALRIMNSTFSGNRARGGSSGMGMGGALFLDLNARVSIVNSAFHGNEAEFLGGGLFVMGNMTLPGQNSASNSIFWENQDSDGMVEGSQIRLANGFTQMSVTYCCIQGFSGLMGTSNIGLDPLFVEAYGPDGRAGTGDEDLRLTLASPCLDAGRNGEIPPDVADLDLDRNDTEDTPIDLDFLPRRVDDPTPDTGSGQVPMVDMGPYERQGS